MDTKLKDIYQDEMRQRVEKLRMSLVLARAEDAATRREALYDAHLHAHTIKGTSEQLGLNAAAQLGSAMSDALEHAREEQAVAPGVKSDIDRACNALTVWIDSGLEDQRAMVMAAAAFATGDSRSAR